MAKVKRLKEIARATGIVCHFDEPKFLWLYVPRTASRCMTHTFESMGLKLERLDNVPDVDIDEYLLWTFVRNPFTKVVSAMTWFQVTWDEFIAKNHLYIKEGLQEEPRRVGRHMIPNTFFTHVDNEPIVDFLGYFENIEDDWKRLLDRLKLPDTPLVINKWSTRKNKKDFDNRAVDIIIDMYRDDFNLLGYDTNIQQ